MPPALPSSSSRKVLGYRNFMLMDRRRHRMYLLQLKSYIGMTEDARGIFDQFNAILYGWVSN